MFHVFSDGYHSLCLMASILLKKINSFQKSSLVEKIVEYRVECKTKPIFKNYNKVSSVKNLEF